MFCENCGSRIDDGSLFCPSCGARVNAEPMQPQSAQPQNYGYTEQPQVQQQYYDPGPQPGPVNPEGPQPAPQPAPKRAPKEKKPINKKLLIIIGAAAAAVILLAVLAVIFLPKLLSGGMSAGSSGGDSPKIFSLYDGRYLYAAPEADADVNDLLNDEKTDAVYTNRYNTGAIIYNDGEFFLFDGKKTSSLPNLDDKDFTFYTFVGNGGIDFVYSTDDSLVLYQNGKETIIGDEGMLKKVTFANVITAADGSAIGYSLTDNDGNSRGYVWDGKKSIELGKNNLPLFISDGAKYLYYENYSSKGEKSSLVVRKGLNSSKEEILCSSESSINCGFNKSGNEVLFMNDDKTFLSVDGKAATKVLSTSSPDLVQKYGDNHYGGNSTQKIFGTMLNFDSFANRFYIVDGTMYYVNAKAEANRVVKHVDSAFLSSDGKTVFYRDDEKNLYKINGTKDGAEPELLVDEDCWNFIISADGKTVFYENTDDELIALKNGKETMLSDAANPWFNTAALFAGKTFVFIEDNELYLTSGDKPEQVRGLNQDVVDFQCGEDYILIDGEEEILFSKDGKKFSVVYTK